MAEVTLENISKIYPGGVKAVDNVSLRIADREFVVLVGPSGCGKSTTLRMVAGLEDISGGTIRIGPRVINDVAPKDRDIAMVFQNYALYPHMNVYRNMSFGLMLRRKYGLWDNPVFSLLAPGKYRQARAERTAIDQRVRGAAETLGITPLLDRKPRALSGGQRQRVAVGRAIVRNPKAYLFDEPLSNLDAKLRVEMRAEIKKIHRQVQTTTIYVTHDQEEAMTLGDRVVVMKDGIIQQADTPFNTYERPINRFVAGFVGTPPMNFFEGRLTALGGIAVFVVGDQQIALPQPVADRLARFRDQKIVMGVRPEGLSPIGVMRAAGEEHGQAEYRLSVPPDVPPDVNPPGSPPAGGSHGHAEYRETMPPSMPPSISLGMPPVLRMQITLVEPLGDRMDVIGSAAGNGHVVARVDSKAPVREATTVDMRIDPDRIHFFEMGPIGRNVLLG